ncbi:hypothetical protein PHYBLDRAFT_157756 [Phycomyces blakesleeanus NRRL 1555(-)]|uniref:Uncharacterized protein n=1 Tax=Phycomyces blakesleeanus (strain ATCC 8743b / DSM 1359 / FGSC 10004 / NBRC 33097 / NRRL 1555) TaxID=763407 RepID=A0A162UQ95_PHYB8|nr:hypothetical protein PHYBLDRAFT_157756 [Phycomyces blakesleeanus NRRL 1555(-)]OAD77432.1 hypothetical protein PHYBLDRAFT_157756 [Phycomyces blakesleeanus NRRL 1555(-)]|eukprot:XP_018295472.1 hypothetical protein PHYBLDRAFT_157756 [Phycomyces blakesleeanus NRRL 1555(-)]
MTRTKQSSFGIRHEHHTSRNGLSDVRNLLKKSGGGLANWGMLGEEVMDIEPYETGQHIQFDTTVRGTGNKLQLVDEETFYSMRHPEQEV